MLSVGVICIEYGPTLGIFDTRDVHTRVAGEEAGGLEEHADMLHRHDRPAFRTRDMGGSERKEENDVFILNATVTLLHPLPTESSGSSRVCGTYLPLGNILEPFGPSSSLTTQSCLCANEARRAIQESGFSRRGSTAPFIIIAYDTG